MHHAVPFSFFPFFPFVLKRGLELISSGIKRKEDRKHNSLGLRLKLFLGDNQGFKSMSRVLGDLGR